MTYLNNLYLLGGEGYEMVWACLGPFLQFVYLESQIDH